MTYVIQRLILRSGMLNALLPGMEVAILRHEEMTGRVVCLRGKLEEILYEEGGDDTFREGAL